MRFLSQQFGIIHINEITGGRSAENEAQAACAGSIRRLQPQVPRAVASIHSQAFGTVAGPVMIIDDSKPKVKRG